MTMSRGNGFDAVTIQTIAPFTNAQIDRRGNFAVLIDTDTDRRYEFGLYVFSSKGRLRAVLAKPNGRPIDNSPVRRLNSRTVRTEIQRARINSPGTYRFAVYSVSADRPCTDRRPCVDVIPNRLPLIPLDHTAPVVQLVDIVNFSSLISDDTSFPVSFSVTGDPQGTRVTWALEQRVDGGAWTVVDTGHEIGEHTAQIAGSEGSTYDFRLRADDQQDHERLTTEEWTSVPFDDDDPALTYSAGDWAVDTAGHSFGGSDHLSVDVESPSDGVTVSGSFSGSDLCIVGGDPTADGGADISIDGVPEFGLDQDPTSLPGHVWCEGGFESGSHTFTLTVVEGVVSIDGFYGLPYRMSSP
jgi:hypothetical protein